MAMSTLNEMTDILPVKYFAKQLEFHLFVHKADFFFRKSVAVLNRAKDLWR